MDTKERQEKRQELVASGYAWDMIDNWQNKTTLYWHIDKKTVAGGIGFKKGKAIKNVPGTPDYLLKMARKGECKHCSYENKKEEAVDVNIDRVPASSTNKQTSVGDGVYKKPEEKQEAI